MAAHLNELGYALVAADYRLTPRFTYPAQVEDAFCALAWMYANQETYRFDPERIAVMGDSAGGNLAAMIATVDEPGRYLEACPHTLPSSEWIDGAVLFYPPTDFTSTEGHRPVDVGQALEPYFGEAYDMIPAERLAEASPIRWVDGSEPPVLLVQGDADSIVPPWTVEKFADALDQAGATVDMALIEGRAMDSSSKS